MDLKMIDFKELGDKTGYLIAIEENLSIPFAIKRVYYIYGVEKDIRRGFHAHKQLKQVLICVNGNCRIMLDDGRQKATVYLDSPSKGLYIDSMLWREMYDFSPDCVLLVLASEHYDESDYIREYESFVTLSQAGISKEE